MFLYSRCAAYETQYSSRKWERNGISLSNCLFLEMNSYQLSFLTMRNELSSPSLKLMGSVEKEKEILRWQIFYSVVEADLQWRIKEGCVRFHSQLKAI